MKTEIERCPITYNGEDGFEVLYIDYDLWDDDVCEYCMYHGWYDYRDSLATCVDVHGCSVGRPTFFQFIK